MTRGQKAAVAIVGVSLAAILCIVSGFMGYARGQDAGYQIGVLAGVISPGRRHRECLARYVCLM
jgi:hypothetical protein